TTASSLEEKQDSGNIDKTQYKATPNESSSQRTSSGDGPKCQEATRDTIAQTSTQDDAEMFDADKDLGGEEVFVAKQDEKVVKEVVNTTQVSTTATTITTKIDEVTLAQTLVKLKHTKPKAKGIVIQEPSESTTKTTKIISLKQLQDKGKGIMVEEHVKLKKDQIRLDKETALRLQAEFDEEQRLAREKAQQEKEANIALIET
nr:hypothetical protein [Tanacetum cinerariifolium]